MAYFDIFNGDADGICSLQQLRLQQPVDAELVTGLKRDIALLKQVNARSGDFLTVLDISMQKNQPELSHFLQQGVKVFYADHHFSGEIPKSENLVLQINLDANTCTALIINQYLDNAYPLWAIVGAYGDNQDESAQKLAEQLHLTDAENKALKNLGICLNYNGYGFTLDDLIFHPAALYQKIHPYQSPFDFISQDNAFAQLDAAYQEDMALAGRLLPEYKQAGGEIYFMPNQSWARRVSGVFGNQLARQNQHKAHAVLVAMDGGYRVSVRAPLENKSGADQLCLQFEGGGGRKAAAGINLLPESELQRFITSFFAQWS